MPRVRPLSQRERREAAEEERRERQREQERGPNRAVPARGSGTPVTANEAALRAEYARQKAHAREHQRELDERAAAADPDGELERLRRQLHGAVRPFAAPAVAAAASAEANGDRPPSAGDTRAWIPIGPQSSPAAADPRADHRRGDAKDAAAPGALPSVRALLPPLLALADARPSSRPAPPQATTGPWAHMRVKPGAYLPSPDAPAERGHYRVLLMGEPGAGRSTLRLQLQRLAARALASPHARQPYAPVIRSNVAVAINVLTRQRQDLLAYAADRVFANRPKAESLPPPPAPVRGAAGRAAPRLRYPHGMARGLCRAGAHCHYCTVRGIALSVSAPADAVDARGERVVGAVWEAPPDDLRALLAHFVAGSALDGGAGPHHAVPELFHRALPLADADDPRRVVLDAGADVALDDDTLSAVGADWAQCADGGARFVDALMACGVCAGVRPVAVLIVSLALPPFGALAHIIHRVWRDPLSQYLFAHRTQFGMTAPALQQFLDATPAIAADDWVPGSAECVLARQRTAGVVSAIVAPVPDALAVPHADDCACCMQPQRQPLAEWPDPQFVQGVVVMDGGGPKLKMPVLFNALDAPVMVCDLTAWDQPPARDDSPRSTRLHSALRRWHELANSHWFAGDRNGGGADAITTFCVLTKADALAAQVTRYGGSVDHPAEAYARDRGPNAAAAFADAARFERVAPYDGNGSAGSIEQYIAAQFMAQPLHGNVSLVRLRGAAAGADVPVPETVAVGLSVSAAAAAAGSGPRSVVVVLDGTDVSQVWQLFRLIVRTVRARGHPQHLEAADG